MKESDFIKEYKKRRKLKNLKIVKEKIEIFWQTFLEGLKEDEKIIFKGWGSFKIKEKKEKIFKNPRTQNIKKIKTSKKIVFKQGKILKNKMSKEI
ncbi:putative DNA-binding protein (plasmid) [Fusobacterium varium]|nr:putative DNA-binding protein [Fusobacterium varium]